MAAESRVICFCFEHLFIRGAATTIATFRNAVYVHVYTYCVQRAIGINRLTQSSVRSSYTPFAPDTANLRKECSSS